MDLRTRLTRRQLLKLSVAGGAAGLSGLRVSPAGSQAAELVVGMSLDPGHLDPRVEARESFDEAKVRAAYLRVQEIVWDECPWIWLFEQPDINAINRRLKWSAGRRDEYLLFHDATLGA